MVPNHYFKYSMNGNLSNGNVETKVLIYALSKLCYIFFSDEQDLQDQFRRKN